MVRNKEIKVSTAEYILHKRKEHKVARFFLNPGMQNLRSYLKGPKDFLLWVDKLKKQYPVLPSLFSILTMDFKAMYPSMPDELVMPAVKEYLNSRQVKIPSTEKTLQLPSTNSSQVHSLGSPTTSETTLLVNPPTQCTW